MNKSIYPVPASQTDWLARVRQYCLKCCGKSRIAVRECTKQDCEWWACRLEPVQLTFIDKGFREIFYQDMRPCLEAMHGEFTSDDVMAEYHRRYNGDRGPVHPNWIGNAIKLHKDAVGLSYVCHRRSAQPKRKGGVVAVWQRS